MSSEVHGQLQPVAVAQLETREREDSNLFAETVSKGLGRDLKFTLVF